MDTPGIDIKDYLPHRYPFLLIDRVLSMDEGRATALKNVTHTEPFAQGHFPSYPIMPGVLILEAMAQTGRFLIPLHRKVEQPRLARIEDVQFLKEVLPGDQIVIEAILEGEFGDLIKFEAVARVDGDKVATAHFIVHSPQ